MNNYAATGVAFGISAVALWLATRKSKVRYIRWQWRRPHWILLRLFVLVLAFHGIFELFGVHTATGFLLVGLFAAMALTADLSGVMAMAVAAVGFVFHEWIFWLPSRRQLILRNPRPKKTENKEEIVGQEGLATSDLKPTGKITVGGVDREARSDLGFIGKGERVVIESAGDFEVTVRRIDGR